MTRLFLMANAALAWALLAVLGAAFFDQFALGEPPCPLCVMQRIAMMLAALGPCRVLLRANRQDITARDLAVGAGMTIMASLLGMAISVRQVLLHILPGDAGFGPPVLGYHLYTWAVVVFALCIAAMALQFLGLVMLRSGPAAMPRLARATVFAVGLMLVANIVSVVAEAGFAWMLPDNPTTYLLFNPAR